MKLFSILILLLGVAFSCKKVSDRQCFKSYGEIIEVSYRIDSVQEFELFGGIIYEFYQDTARKIVVKGGSNVVNFINVQTKSFITSVHNLNKCDFLRNNDKKITVEIHYPYFSKIYAEPTEPMVFVDTLTNNNVDIELRNGGASLDLTVNTNKIRLNVSFGTSIINVKGIVNEVSFSSQNMGRINALGLTSNTLKIYQASVGDALLNFENSNVLVRFHGNGNVRYIGEPSQLNIIGEGDGEVITY